VAISNIPGQATEHPAGGQKMKGLWRLLFVLPLPAIGQVYHPLDLGQLYEHAEQIKSLEAQRELLEAKAAATRERTEQERARSERESPRSPNAPPVTTEDAHASDVRFVKFLNQIGACDKVYSTVQEQSLCIEKLKLSDPDFARTWVEATTAGIESPELHAHRAELVKGYLASQQSFAGKPQSAGNPDREPTP
jgi:hypothetical protein